MFHQAVSSHPPGMKDQLEHCFLNMSSLIASVFVSWDIKNASYKHDHDYNKITNKSSSILPHAPAPKTPNLIDMRLSLMNVSIDLSALLRFTSKVGLTAAQVL